MIHSLIPPVPVNPAPAPIRHLFPVEAPPKQANDERSPVYDEAWQADRQPAQPGGFGVIPAEVYALGNGYALAVYAALAKHADQDTGECWPSIETLMATTGWTRPTIRKAIRRLADAGVIVVSEHARKGAIVSFHYRLTQHPTVKRHFTVNGSRGNEVAPHGETSLPRTVKRRLRKQYSPEQDQLNTTSVNPPTPQRSPTKPTTKAPPKRDGFDRWYAAYPKHVKRSEAERAWSRLPADAPDADALIAAVQAQRLDEREWRFRPHPASWLNGACWNDEPPPPPVPRPPSPNGHRPAPQQVERGRTPTAEEQKAAWKERGKPRVSS